MKVLVAPFVKNWVLIPNYYLGEVSIIFDDAFDKNDTILGLEKFLIKERPSEMK